MYINFIVLHRQYHYTKNSACGSCSQILGTALFCNWLCACITLHQLLHNVIALSLPLVYMYIITFSVLAHL